MKELIPCDYHISTGYEAQCADCRELNGMNVAPISGRQLTEDEICQVENWADACDMGVDSYGNHPHPF